MRSTPHARPSFILAALFLAAACHSQSKSAPTATAPDPESPGDTRTRGLAEGERPAEAAAPSVAATSAPAADDGHAGARVAAAPPAMKATPAAPGMMEKRPAKDDAPLPVASAAATSPIRAGEWDDNANYQEFGKFLAGVSAPIHHADLGHRRFLVVRDSDNKAVPRCKVTVSQEQHAPVSFVTTASGRAILFPIAEGFAAGTMTAKAECQEGSVTKTFNAEAPDGVVDLKLEQAQRSLGADRIIDVAFILDTTGSMAKEITAVKSTIQAVAGKIANEHLKVRLGLVEYKDRGDPYVTKVYPMTGDLEDFYIKVGNISASGGGDIPEDVNAGLHAAMTELAWSNDSVARMAFMIGDAPPHLDYQNGPDYAADMKVASHRGIQVFTVAASGMDVLGQAVWRQVAQYTGATNMFVLRGGAGPQSTGGGDPIASCGGTQTNYESGNLDALITAKIRFELFSLNADPMRIAGLNGDENAKPCDQRIVRRQQ